MATTITQVTGTFASLLTTELNALASAALCTAGAAYTPTPAGALLADIELVCTFGSAPVAGTGISVWFLTDPDGTNYEDGSSSVQPARPANLTLPVRAVTSAQRIVMRCAIPAGPFKPLALNGTSQAMAATGNTLKILPVTYQGA